MSSIYQGTTPIIKIKLSEDYPEHLIQDVECICINIVQGSSFISKSLEDLELNLEENCFELRLSEDETYRFSATVFNIQVYYKMIGSDDIFSEPVLPVRVIPSLVNKHSENVRNWFDDREGYIWQLMKMQ